MDIEQQMARDEQAMERIASALEQISKSLATWCILESAKFDKQYPVKANVRDATITRTPSDEDKLLESLGATNEPLEDWIGLREQQVVLEKIAQGSTAPRSPRTHKK